MSHVAPPPGPDPARPHDPGGAATPGTSERSAAPQWIPPGPPSPYVQAQPAPRPGAHFPEPARRVAAPSGAANGGWSPPGGARPSAQPQGPTQSYGYRYRDMPAYPAPHFPQQAPPPPRRRGGPLPGWVMALGAVLVVALVVLASLVFIQDRNAGPTAGPDPGTMPTDDGYGRPNTEPDGRFTGTHLSEQLNAALAARDRDLFFSYVGGDAVAPLSLWWDNMEILGWSRGVFSMQGLQNANYRDNTAIQSVQLGAVTAGSPTIPTDSDHPDAGRAYAPVNDYRATIAVSDDGASGLITGWEVEDDPAPWDLEPLYAVITEHSVVAGYEDESELVDSVAEAAEESARWVVERYESETGVANAQRFLSFYSDDMDRFNSWFINPDEIDGWTGDRAGTLFPQARPFPSAGVPDDIASGGWDATAGGIVTVGPNGLAYGIADTQDTITHEFIHAIHEVNVPRAAYAGPIVTEGWATYNESLFQGHGTYATRLSYTGRVLRGCVEDMDGSFPSPGDFDDVDDVSCAYALSGSVYAYADSLGIDVFELSDTALETGDSLTETAGEIGDVELTEDGWAGWLGSNFG
ncbi:hypothetical protein OCAE111667_13955 [Occultella aeris]|uniref:Uncharacterized protein n=2 Tax=Occultella aeris TaxID=2761496 RepID=A0A7M4DIY6_9MICO|nr:hypothetical protein HALOF300_02089 [Occultella aeris]